MDPQEKAQKLEMLKKKKELEEKVSNEAYALLEKGSNAVQTHDFDTGIKFYQEAIQKFKEINWVTEMKRVEEIIKETKAKSYDFKEQQQKAQAPKPKEPEKITISTPTKIETESVTPKSQAAPSVKQAQVQKSDQNKQKVDLAVNLIDQANLLATNKDFEQAISKIREAKGFFEQIGWTTEAERLEFQIGSWLDQQQHQEILLRRQAGEAKKKEDTLKEFEKEAELSKRLKDQKEKEEQELRKKQIENRERAKAIADEVFKKIDQIEFKVKTYEDAIKQGRMLVTEAPFDEAIQVYHKAKIQLREIGWTEEANRLDDAIRNYQMRQAKDQQQRQLELKRITDKQQQEEALKQQIESSQKNQQQKEAELQQLIQIEKQKNKSSQKIQDECMDLLDKAKAFLDSKKFPDAIGIYQEVITKYEQIGWNDGVRITKEALLKAQQDYQRHLREQQFAQKIQEDAEKSQKDMDERIKSSQEEEERKRVEMQKHFLDKKKKEERDKKLNDELFQLLEKASNDVLQENFDEAIELYRRSLEIIRELDWTIKIQQISDLLTDTKNKKMAYLKKLKANEEQRQRKELEQKAFEEKLQREEETRKQFKSDLEKKQQFGRQKANQEKMLSDASWKLLDDAEKSIKGENKYLGISYLHQSLRNFNDIGWVHEALTTKQRIIQVLDKLKPCLVDQLELLVNENIDLESKLLEKIGEFEFAKKVQKLDKAATLMKEIKDLAQQLHWSKTFNLITTTDDAFQQEYDAWKKEQNSPKPMGPTPESAAQLMADAKIKVRENKFDEALELAKQATQIYFQLNMDREIKMINTEIALWKLKADDFAEKQKSPDTFEPPKTEDMTEEEKRKALIEDRKKQRREERKKLRDE